ncbi:restriction endonuclease subunit S [Avibacterium avium]|uniref:restriction endonuclease subunit S n=1 Tax=Avibacterium avium TaxID=751 RepID=UPI003BF85088
MKLKLKDLVKIKGGKRLPKGSNLQTIPNKHPYIKVKDMKNKFISLDGLEYVPDEIFTKIKNYIVNENDIIISIVGTIGLVSIIDSKLNNASQTENCAKLSGLDYIDSEYLYYFLISEYGQSEINKATVGAVQPKLPLYGIENIEIDWKTREDREKIIYILRNIDNKIELNTQTNQTLEQIAQGIFKHWFIDFAPVHAKANALARGETTEQAELATMACLSGKTVEKITALKTQDPTAYHQLQQTAAAFPSEFVETEMGEVPRGWEVKPINEICRVVYGKGLPKNQLRASGYPVYGANGIIGYYDQYLYENRQVLVGCRGTVGQVYVSQPYSYITSNSLVIEYEKTTINLYFLELYLKSLDLSIFASGSVQPQITIQNLLKLKILIPGKEILDSFATLVEPIYQLTYKNDDEKKTLSETRDLLLPKLLNGEIEL